MAQNKKFYSLVGDNGYGLFTTWDDLQEAAIRLEGSLTYRKLPTARDAYKAILKDVMFRWRIKKVGVMDLASLLKKQFVLLDEDADADEDDTDVDIDAEEQEAPVTVGSIYQKPSNKGGRVCGRKYGTLAELLAEDDEEQTVTQAQPEDPDKENFVQMCVKWYEKHKNELVEEENTKNMGKEEK